MTSHIPTAANRTNGTKGTRECFFRKKKGRLKKDCQSYKREQKKKEEGSKDATESAKGKKNNKKDDKANRKADVVLDLEQLERTLAAHSEVS
jgi:hypothetical protein